MKNQKGITLVALVVTIIVLLILAGVTIAMLTGENGIITNTQKADAANEEATAIEKMGLAYSTAKTEAMVQMALTRGYQPSNTTNAEALATVVANELGTTVTKSAFVPGTALASTGEKYYVYLDGATITMVYSSPKFAAKSTDTAGADNLYPNIVSVITLTTNSVQNTTPAVRKVK